MVPTGARPAKLPLTVSTLELFVGEAGVKFTLLLVKSMAIEDASAVKVISPVIAAACAPAVRNKVAKTATADVILSFIVVIVCWGVGGTFHSEKFCI